MKYFAESEFACNCGQCSLGFKNMQTSTLTKLNSARKIAAAIDPSIKFILTSAMRCPEWNKSEGGSSTSSHLTGYAIDIKTQNSQQRFVIVWSLLSAGFNRIGVANTFCHADDDPSKPKEVIWTY